MREHVARAQAFQHFPARGRRMIDVRHQRQAQLLGDLQRHVQRRDAGGAAGAAADAHLDADDQVRILARDAHALVQVEEQQVRRFADHHGAAEGEDAGKGDVEVGEDAHQRGLDHVLAKAGKVARAGGAGVDERGGAAPPRERLGLDANRRAAPVDVGVQVNHPGDDEATGDIALFLRWFCDPRRHGGNAAAGEADVTNRIKARCRVDHPASAQY